MYPYPGPQRDAIGGRVRVRSFRTIGAPGLANHERAAVVVNTRTHMTRTHNHTRKKANAVFFSAIMVLSMVAIGFAVAPAAAVPASADADDYDRLITSGNTVYQGQLVLVDAENVDGAGANFEQDDVELRRVDDGEVGGLVSTPELRDEAGDQHFILDTTNRNADRYVLTAESRGTPISEGAPDDSDLFTFEVAVQDLTVEFDDDDVGDSVGDSEVDIEIDSDIRNRYVVNVTADGLDASELEDVFTRSSDYHGQEITTLPARSDVYDQRMDTQYFLDDDEDRIVLFNAEGEHTLNFTDISTGDYEFEFEVFDSTAEDADSITVVEGDVGDVVFAEDTIDIEQGGVVNVTLVSTDAADAAQLVIGDTDDIGYQLNATIDFDGDDEVTVAFNTYAAGAGGAGDFAGVEVLEIVSDGDASFVDIAEGSDMGHSYSENTVENLLDVGDYQLTVKAGSDSDFDAFDATLDDPDDIGSLFIDERDLNAWNTWISPSGTEIEDFDDIAAGIEAGNVTENGEVAHEDLIVHQIDGTGLTGILKAAEQSNAIGASSPTEAFVELATGEHFDNDGAGFDNLDLRIRETRDSAGPNAERLRVDVAASGVDVIVDDSGVFIVMDTDDLEFIGAPDFDPRVDDLDKETDYEFDVRFRNQDVRLLEFEDDDDEEIEDVREQLDAQFEIEEAFYDFEADPYNVTADADVVFAGTTNAAPGTEHTARVRSTGDTRPRFNVNEDFSVDAEQDWATDEFDMSETSVGDTFELSLGNTIAVETPEVDGNVIEALDTPTPTPDDTPTPEPEPEPEPTPEPEPEPTPEPEPEPEPTDDDTPGFGAVVALIALIAAALLATRRRP